MMLIYGIVMYFEFSVNLCKIMDIFTFFFEISILVNDQNKTFNFLFLFRLIIVGKFQLAYL